jgi:hypothetical protein
VKLSSAAAVLWFCSIASALAGGYMFLSAISTASLRYHYCGPTSLDHVEPACRIGTKLLLASYGLGALAFLLAVGACWLSWRRRAGSDEKGGSGTFSSS